MAHYEPVGEHIYLMNPEDDSGCYVECSSVDVFMNPRRTSAQRVRTGRRTFKDFRVEVPLGEYENLRVRTALVRHLDYGREDPVIVTSSADVYRVMKTVSHLPAESMFVILLNARNAIIGIHQVAMGGTIKAVVESRNMLQAAIIANAVAMIMVHNHPSGAAEPSPEDIGISRGVEKSANMLGIKLLDHVVIGDGQYISLADRGLI